ncbi:hormogonium polysaccharide biosynthesis protein HpsA [Dendronalium sp. ChiSLP03b]|uniref:hormogonium polysaccharide biosynthesis protein HpsA n=1 Tax=Dendronalium sp. ChiSLP03b TaxID=3075381 RepID=UPI002AD5984C|nr:hormogonium polysaccharide biosynthesis protein HpsA [Dendronalium sp. ChiSLP03b]MDZ8203316.1 hormogonium polysaccharide biosynthesis protein HpsA [Dendronalium sp. ChiSLP03b]
MFTKRQLAKTIKKISKEISKSFISPIKKQIIWLLRTLFVTKRRRSSVNAGFVLPTVAMVALVVILLTTAILFRSFERSKNASNVRVNEAVLSAASPALDRARAKINKLFQDPKLPRSTPSDFSLYQVLTSSINQYTFGDETQLKLVNDFNGTSGIQTNTGSLDTEESLTTAWKYPVDTNNDGKFDSFTLYGVYLRSPSSDRPRSPLEARTPPMNETDKGTQCDEGSTTSAQLVGTQGWYKRAGTLKRGIFVYTTTVPITEIPTGLTSTEAAKYQIFKGNKGFAALEYEQDRERFPVSNNAVLYNDDLEIAPGGGLRLNGRIVTNGNLLTGKTFDPIRLYLVSSPKSCYYSEGNSKIIVGGNVSNGRVVDNNDDLDTSNSDGVQVDFFKKAGPGGSDRDFINSTNKSVTLFGSDIAYNSKAYEMRIDLLVRAAKLTATLPQEVTQEVTRQINADATLDSNKVREEQLKIYFRKRTRRVPYAEVPFGDEVALAINKSPNVDYTTSDVLQGSNSDNLRPPDNWIYPYAFSDGITHANYSGLPIKLNGTNKIYLPTTATKLPEPQGDEARIGDRIVVGNNLPEIWWNGTKFVSQLDGLESGQSISNKQWDATASGVTNPRKRFPQVHELDDLGITDRDDFWEKKAAEQPQGELDVVGGLRVITGAGIYKRTGSFLSTPPTRLDNPSTLNIDESLLPVVWPDSMPMWDDTDKDGIPETTDQSGDLIMRATVVYHYKDNAYNPQSATTYQTPIACVSSYYDSTTSQSAINQNGYPDVRLRDTDPNTVWNTTGLTNNPNLTGLGTVASTAAGRSNNGVTYQFSGAQASTISGISVSNGIFSYASGADDPTDSTKTLKDRLSYQANLVFPNGRFVNEPLRKALTKISQSKPLTLSEQSAADSAICALKLVDGSTMTPSDSVIPHGAIRETTFLDARQIKAIDQPGTSQPTYDLDVEQRQPLEIRATVLDLNLLRKKSIGTGEFLLPNSGIIYATRDDASPDASDSTSDLSSNDFKLDPNRRPNGIMLIHGSDLSRNTTYKPEEKGLILATNLPVYIKGNFNTHSQEEFDNTTHSENLDSTWSNFYTRTYLNSNFACRKDQFTACTTGETWRPATVIADAITILSNNFLLGFRNEGDYDLRDNISAAVGYDYDDIGGITTNAVTLNETTLQLDLDGDGNLTDNVTTMNETTLGVDLNSDGDTSDNAVNITEQNIPSFIARRLNGFWDNNFVTSFGWIGDNNGNSNVLTNTVGNAVKSSYFNNFVTPIQRQTKFAEYVMEICRKPTVSACKPNDWSVGYDTGSGVDWDYKATSSGTKRILPNNSSFTVDKLGAGTTARPAKNAADQHYPRRVAFLRDTSGNLITTGTAPNLIPIPLGISGNDNPALNDTAGKISYYPYETSKLIGGIIFPKFKFDNVPANNNRPRLNDRALWFQTINDSTGNYFTGNSDYSYKYFLSIKNISGLTNTRKTDQPLLVPVLQIHYPFGKSDDNPLSSKNVKDDSNNWLQVVTDNTTETNLAFVQGDTPGRPIESNGGLENFVRYLENWQETKNHKVVGAFIQYKRSSYATAPWQTFTESYTQSTGYSTTETAFGYPQAYRTTVNKVGNITFGRTPFYVQPNRAWGFDVALLTQLPDLFSQRFTSPNVGDPNEYYREVGRDDRWVQTLLCGATTGQGYDSSDASYGTGFKYAISKDQRPSTCPS